MSGTPQISTWLSVGTGDRLTTEGHLKVRLFAGPGPWCNVTLAAGTYRSFTAACTQLQTALNAAGVAGTTFAVVESAASVSLVADHALDWQWYDSEAAAYFGFTPDVSYPNGASIDSDQVLAGKILLTWPVQRIELWDRLHRKYQTRPGGYSVGILLARHSGWTVDYLLTPAEMLHFAAVLRRLGFGNPAQVTLDTAHGTVHDWTAAAWLGGRSMALDDPGAAVDCADFLETPYYTERRVRLRWVEVTP